MLKKSLMRSVQPSDQLLRAFFRPALRPPSGRTGEFSAGVQRSLPLDATGAQAMHAVGVFSNGRQIWLARVFKFCTMAARWDSSRAPEKPRNRIRSKPWCLQVRKAHLDLLALVTRFGELRCTHQGACRIACVLMHVARDLSEGHIRGALGLERTWTAVAGARAIKDSPAIMHRPGCPEKLTLRADVEVVLPIEGKVRARQDAFFSLAHVPKQGCAV